MIFIKIIKGLLLISFSLMGNAQEVRTATFGMTTTLEGSGFSQALIKALEKDHPDWKFSYSIAGTSQQLRSLKDGFIPFAITHNATQEEVLTEKNHYQRTSLFKNDFLLVGPSKKRLHCDSIDHCLMKLVNKNETFLSRGDGSGTHIYELAQWNKLWFDPMMLPNYLSASGGAANSLRICRIKNCYLMIDESTFQAQTVGKLAEIVRDRGVNIYSLVYSTDYLDSAAGAKIIHWLTSHAPALSQQFGYKLLTQSDDD